MAAPVTRGTNFDAATSVALFQATPRPPVLVYDFFVYDMSHDGQRFVVNAPVKQTDTQPCLCFCIGTLDSRSRGQRKRFLRVFRSTEPTSNLWRLPDKKESGQR